MKRHRLVGIGPKIPVDHDAMKMHMGIERGTKTVDEGDGTDAGGPNPHPGYALTSVRKLPPRLPKDR
jgi:hypothetical protein